MRGLMRASLWTLTRKSRGSRETEITAFAVMPSTFSFLPLVTTVTPVGKWLIALLRAPAPSPMTSQEYPRSFVPSAGILAPSGGPNLLQATTIHAQLFGPPAPDHLPVRAVPTAETLAVMDVVYDDVLRAGEPGRL